MADEGDEKKQQQNEESKADSVDKKSSGGRLLWIIMAVVVIVGAGAGFGLGRLLGSSQTNNTDTRPAGAEEGSSQSKDLTSDTLDLTASEPQQTWYFTLEPVVANLNEPSVTRYVRVTLTLVMDSNIDQKKGTAFIEEKKPILTNWLTIYLASLTIDDIRGDRNLKRIQSQIVDGFNEKLFPDAKPHLKGVLFKEFAVQ